MITEIDLKKAILDLLKTKYAPPEYHYYGIEVTEGCEKPYFFTDLRLMRQQDETANIVSKEYYLAITYQGKKTSEEDNFNKIEEIRELLCCIDDKNRKRKMVLKVKDRYIKIEDFSYTYTGEANNILQIQIEMSFYDFVNIEIEEKIAQYVQLNMKKED